MAACSGGPATAATITITTTTTTTVAATATAAWAARVAARRAMLVLALALTLASRAAVDAADADVVGARVGGNYALATAKPGARCAPNVNHVTSAQAPYAAQGAPGSQPAFYLPDANIYYGPDACAGVPGPAGPASASLDLYTAAYAAAPAAAPVAATYPALLQDGAFIGVQANGRACGQWSIPAGTAFLFVTPSSSQPFPQSILSLRPTLAPLQPGSDYMLAFVPASSGGDAAPSCIYSKGSTAQSSQRLSTTPQAGANSSGAGTTANGGPAPTGGTPSGAEGAKSSGRTGIIAGAAAGGLLLLVAAIFLCCLVSRRKKAAEESAYYKFEAASAGHSGSVAARPHHHPKASGLVTPWQMVRVGTSSKTKDVDPINPTTFRDRSERAAASSAGHVMDSGRESVDSAHSSEIAAPMLSPFEAARAGGVVMMQDAPNRRAPPPPYPRPSDMHPPTSDDEDVVVIA